MRYSTSTSLPSETDLPASGDDMSGPGQASNAKRVDSSKVLALSKSTATSPFVPTYITRRACGPHDVHIRITHAGICHSDIHLARNEWASTNYPITPGHEIVGEVTDVGSEVTQYEPGDRVGVGCLVDSCRKCSACVDGLEQFCAAPATWTYNSPTATGEITRGGYSESIVVAEHFVCPIPEGMDSAAAAPLLCAGVTTYAPLKKAGIAPGDQVAVMGLGGLGHMAVQIAAAMGAEVTVLSRSRAKAATAAQLGASATYATADADTFRALRGKFAFILNTISADVPIADYVNLVRPGGSLVNVGLPMGDFILPPRLLVGANRSLGGSLIGGLDLTREMLQFCADNQIAAWTELVHARDVEDTYDRVVAGKVAYRAVIDISSLAELSSEATVNK